jgi:hypothetical protein
MKKTAIPTLAAGKRQRLQLRERMVAILAPPSASCCTAEVPEPKTRSRTLVAFSIEGDETARKPSETVVFLPLLGAPLHLHARVLDRGNAKAKPFVQTACRVIDEHAQADRKASVAGPPHDVFDKR